MNILCSTLQLDFFKDLQDFHLLRQAWSFTTLILPRCIKSNCPFSSSLTTTIEISVDFFPLIEALLSYLDVSFYLLFYAPIQMQTQCTEKFSLWECWVYNV